MTGVSRCGLFIDTNTKFSQTKKQHKIVLFRNPVTLKIEIEESISRKIFARNRKSQPLNKSSSGRGPLLFFDVGDGFM